MTFQEIEILTQLLSRTPMTKAEVDWATRFLNEQTERERKRLLEEQRRKEAPDGAEGESL